MKYCYVYPAKHLEIEIRLLRIPKQTHTNTVWNPPQVKNKFLLEKIHQSLHYYWSQRITIRTKTQLSAIVVLGRKMQ